MNGSTAWYDKILVPRHVRSVPESSKLGDSALRDFMVVKVKMVKPWIASGYRFICSVWSQAHSEVLFRLIYRPFQFWKHLQNVWFWVRHKHQDNEPKINWLTNLKKRSATDGMRIAYAYDLEDASGKTIVGVDATYPPSGTAPPTPTKMALSGFMSWVVKWESDWMAKSRRFSVLGIRTMSLHIRITRSPKTRAGPSLAGFSLRRFLIRAQGMDALFKLDWDPTPP